MEEDPMKKMMTLLLMLLLALCIVGCGGEEAPAPTDGDALTASALYAVTVTDEAGQPISGVMLQLCSDVCMLGTTNEAGEAWFHVDPADYKVSITAMPQGYALAGEATEFTFPEGSTKLTIVLKAE